MQLAKSTRADGRTANAPKNRSNPAIPGERRDSMICKVRECYRGAMFFGLSGHFVM